MEWSANAAAAEHHNIGEAPASLTTTTTNDTLTHHIWIQIKKLTNKKKFYLIYKLTHKDRTYFS